MSGFLIRMARTRLCSTREGISQLDFSQRFDDARRSYRQSVELVRTYGKKDDENSTLMSK